jgi:hypothetical protein
MMGIVTAFVVPRGATGFRSSKSAPLPLVDLKHLRAAWHAAAHLAAGRIGEFDEQSYPRTFHVAKVTGRDGLNVILCHAHFPLVAFATGQHAYYTTEFTDPPNWASAFAAAGFDAMSAAALLSPLEDADTSDLLADDWRQIRRWRPATLGAALFNSWD